MMWNISSGFLTEPYSGYKQDFRTCIFTVNYYTNSVGQPAYLFSDDDIQVYISMDKISILISSHCTFDTHQAVFLTTRISCKFSHPIHPLIFYPYTWTSKKLCVHFMTTTIHCTLEHAEVCTLVCWNTERDSKCFTLPGLLKLVFTQQMSSQRRNPHFWKHCNDISHVKVVLYSRS